ncbi:hypothetical protein [Allokutzneria albata]|uniref:Uncharacterized protein n=1 Tax=Allokutzneria albata TaxID=211114 RepID=A0A1G9VJ84_ALLAB|nr:hypothetical protein [Allokutzneria albata]SDM72170.1 hypothetical protein SAMN04489726_3067 [Allokutzneria albata]
MVSARRGPRQASFFATIGPTAPKPDSPLLAYGHCGEALPPNDTAAFTVAISAPGPVGKPVPNRTIELRTDGKVARAHHAPSRDVLDRLWFDWSYQRAHGRRRRAAPVVPRVRPGPAAPPRAADLRHLLHGMGQALNAARVRHGEKPGQTTLSGGGRTSRPWECRRA